jgi:hypothetical protein
MSCGSVAYRWHVAKYRDTRPLGGSLRHSQDDMISGTDLRDLQTAWQRYGGQVLTIRSGRGWQALVDDLDAWRAVVLQGSGRVPGASGVTVPHAVAIIPPISADRIWVAVSDPWYSGYQRLRMAQLRDWARRWQTSIAYAVSRPQPPIDPPDPPDPPPVPGDERGWGYDDWAVDTWH